MSSVRDDGVQIELRIHCMLHCTWSNPSFINDVNNSYHSCFYPGLLIITFHAFFTSGVGKTIEQPSEPSTDEPDVGCRIPPSYPFPSHLPESRSLSNDSKHTLSSNNDSTRRPGVLSRISSSVCPTS